MDLARERFGEVNGLADELGLIAVAFEAHLKEREEAASEDDEQTNEPALVGTPYRIVDGGIVRLKNTREGEIPQRLTNFTASVEEEIIRDDGAEVRRIYSSRARRPKRACRRRGTGDAVRRDELGLGGGDSQPGSLPGRAQRTTPGRP